MVLITSLYYVYMLTNKNNNVFYVGVSNNVVIAV